MALNFLGYPLSESDVYDEAASQCVRQLQSRESHPNVDGLTGPGTRGLIARLLLARDGRRIFHVFTDTDGELFPTVFVSYAREDRSVASDVARFLDRSGVRVWIDFENLRPGERWDDAIARVIPSARYFLALLSHASLSKKGFVQKEVRRAWDVAEHYPDTDIFIIPARLESCQIHETKFSGLNYIDLFPDPQPGLQRLLSFLADGD